MLENLANLYQEIIIEHSKNPRNAGTLDSPNTKKKLGINPSCGDKLLLTADIENNTFANIKHNSEGCSIFRASCSLMSQMLIGKTLPEAENIIKQYIKIITFDNNPDSVTDEEYKILGKLAVFQNIQNYPARVKCAALFARTLEDLIQNDDQEDIATTE
ncbi:MAG: Fe-S cluster assembly sulfur transfer protein SufU [Brevinemataceae bacterium]